MATRNPANRLRLVVYPIVYRVFIHPWWLFGISEPSTGWHVFIFIFLVGGWTNPFEKYESKWKSFPNRGWKLNIFETSRESCAKPSFATRILCPGFFVPRHGSWTHSFFLALVESSKCTQNGILVETCWNYKGCKLIICPTFSARRQFGTTRWATLWEDHYFWLLPLGVGLLQLFLNEKNAVKKTSRGAKSLVRLSWSSFSFSISIMPCLGNP